MPWSTVQLPSALSRRLDSPKLQKRRAFLTALCEALQQVWAGQADDLGGGVYKKRLNDNRHRSIILAKGARYWIYEYLFAKQDRSNIDEDELLAFRLLAKSYAGLTAAQVSQLLAGGDFMEICHGDETKI